MLGVQRWRAPMVRLCSVMALCITFSIVTAEIFASVPEHTQLYSVPEHTQLYSVPEHTQLYSVPEHTQLYSVPEHTQQYSVFHHTQYTRCQTRKTIEEIMFQTIKYIP